MDVPAETALRSAVATAALANMVVIVKNVGNGRQTPAVTCI